MSCHCGKETKEIVCGDKPFSCGQVCGRKLDCGSHSCEKPCHEGQCLPCQKDPSRVRFCPSGHKSIEELLGHQRKHCTDEIPTCDNLCERFLPCGMHQCIKKCHTDDCMICEETVVKKCICGKQGMKVACYKVNYPNSVRKKHMTQEEIDEVDNFKCKRVCNAVKKCGKHQCKEICCPVKREMGRAGDPEGRHLCMMTCNKMQSCGIHRCEDFCHLGFCKPCKRASNQPMYCPCGIAKLDPPIQCGVPPPTCKGPCKKVLDCGHPCSSKCHNGPCPPCLETVARLCNCGKELMTNVFCHKKNYNCGQVCNLELKCGHNCQKVCHIPGKCINSIEELMENGCGQRCGQLREECGHKCQALCHPGKPCPKTPCDAEVRVYCVCGHRWINVECKSNPERPPIECDARCLKKQRDERIATAFGTTENFSKSKGTIKFEYYPEDTIQFTQENLEWVKKLENTLTYLARNKFSTKTYSSLNSAKRQFLATLVFEHFNLDMCTYGSQGQKRVTDVFWREGAKVPEVLVSDIATAILKGVEGVRQESSLQNIFEATVFINNVPKGSNIDALKQHLQNFKNEMYTEKGQQFGSFKIHFYCKMRAKDALSYLHNSPSQFTNAYMVQHSKEIGIRKESSDSSDLEESKTKGKKAKLNEDDDGFTTVKTKKFKT